jgi:hypothetical protein
MKKLIISALVLGACCASVGFADGSRCDALAAGSLSWHTGDNMSTYGNCSYESTKITQPYKNHLTYTLSVPTTTGCDATKTHTVVITHCGDGAAGDEDYIQGVDDKHQNAVTGTIYRRATGELRFVDTYRHATIDALIDQ